MRTERAIHLLVILAIGLCGGARAVAVEHVVFQQEGREITVDGRVVIEAEDGGVLLQGRDGALWTIPPDEQVRRTSDKSPFTPLSHEELGKRILAELPDGFDVYSTTHYLICYNTSRVYAQWCGALFERLYMAFSNYWGRKDLKIEEPEFPLVAIVFADRPSYLKHAHAELGDAAGSIIGYFSLRTNRMTMYDLSGMSQWSNGRRRTTAQINEILARPEAERTIATVVHEATHQIAYNCGLHARYGDCPLWFCEGLAVYFETPDLGSSKSWTIRGLNGARLAQFYEYLGRRPNDSLATLVSKDDRFRNPDKALDAYAEAWALTYFLINKHGKQYVEYVKKIGEKKPLLPDTPDERLKEFQEVFGNLADLDREFLRYIQRTR